MQFAMSTVGQGVAAYIAVPALTNGSTAAWEIGGEFIIHDLSVNQQVVGQSSSTQNVLRIYPDGSICMRSGATDRIRSVAGLIQVDLPFQWKIKNNTTTGNWELYAVDLVNPIGVFARGATAWPINQIGRFSTTAATPTTVRSFYAAGAASYVDNWDETGAGSSVNWVSDGGTRNLTITSYTGALNSWWIAYGGVAQHQSTGGTATQAATGTADTTARNSQLKATAGSAEQSATTTADTSPLNGQNRSTNGTAAQSTTGTADSTATNSQHNNSAGSAGQVCSAQANTAPLNNQHRQSAGQLLSVAGFIADTSWVNTVDLGEVQHRSTSGSASQSATETATTSALNSQHRQTGGTAAQAATGTANTTASNNQHRQSAGQVLSVAGFIASTSWVNTVDLGNIQHRGTSGSSTQAATADATATAINGQNRQSAGRATAECTATASTSRVNTILQKAVYIRRIESRSITKKIYHTASRHKIDLKTQSGGGYMQELNFKQGASALLQIEHTIDGEAVSGISEAKYELYGRTGQVLVTKELGEGIEFSAGLIEIQLTEDDTADLSQSYNHQCVAKDLAGLTFFPLNGQITFGATKPRL